MTPEQIEQAAPGAEREVLIVLAKRIYGWVTWDNHDPDEWVRRWNNFHRKLDAEAYESAAMMLVPEGWRPYMADTGAGDWVVSLSCDLRDSTFAKGKSPVLALALCAAIARTMETEHGQ